MSARIGVVTFPGSLDDVDAARAIRIAGGTAVALWHGDTDLHGVDAAWGPVELRYGIRLERDVGHDPSVRVAGGSGLLLLRSWLRTMLFHFVSPNGFWFLVLSL